MFTLILFSVAIALLASPVIGLLRNYRKARSIGLPILFTPFSIMSPLYGILAHRIGPYLVRHRPLGLGGFVRYSGFFCYWHDRYRLHEEYGPAFCVVNPSEIQVIIADGEAVDSILARRKDFIKCPSLYQPLEIFGPNVDSLNGEDWQRHRRLTTPPFNERNSSHVWKESHTQASGMLQAWLRKGVEGVAKTSSDTLTLALHVLTAAGLGQRYEFEAGLTKLTGDHCMSYRDALQTVLGHIFASIIITSLKLPSAILPKSALHIKQAIAEFKQYMAEMVEEERASIHNKDAEKDNLMSTLIRASESAEARKGLSNDEIYGNLFIYNLAGHDTTAHTLGYAVTLMATDLKVQAWIREELDFVFGSKVDELEDDYERAFPLLKRCLALMYETLRLYGPIVVIPKYVGHTHTVQLSIAGKVYNIPPDTHTPINVAALNTLPKYWGHDSLTFRPDRWIINRDPKDLLQDQHFEPASGVFVPWAAGPRICPGKKFAQVEFVAVISKLFRNHTVRPLLMKGESVEAGNMRIMNMVDDSHLVITLQMSRPEKVKLIWEEVP